MENIMEYQKLFFNEKNKQIYKTLKEAKSVDRNAGIYRCWCKDGQIIAKYEIHKYGEHICTIKIADEKIARMIKGESVHIL